jgi:pimeloyl-ACP methyl ester carboxylesterase
MKTAPCVAVCRRNNRVAIVVLDDSTVYDIRRLKAPRHSAARVVRVVRSVVAAYGAHSVVHDGGKYFLGDTTLPTETLRLRDAKSRLCGSPSTTHADLIAAVLTARPELEDIARDVPVAGLAGRRDRWRSVPLLAVALALAHLQD